jgi:myosin heavy subunit
MANQDFNPRAVEGDNRAPDFARLETLRLVDEYKGFSNTLLELSDEADKVPDEITSDDEALKTGAIIKRFRDLSERLENTRAIEKEPHLRRGNAVDSFFNGLKKIIAAGDKNERRVNPGWIDKLQAKINAYQDAKEARERARLEAERIAAQKAFEEAQRKAEAERQAAARLAAEAEQRRLEAERARAPAKIEEKTAAAQEAAQSATAAETAAFQSDAVAEQSRDAATEARLATYVKPADIVRTRGITEQGAGVTLTKAKENYAEVVDRSLLDATKLFPYFSDAEVEKALRGFAKATQYREQMAGAEIGTRTKGVTR